MSDRKYRTTLISVLTLAGGFFLARALLLERSDVWAYVAAGRRILSAVTPYSLNDETPFKYLPPVAYLFIPLAPLGHTVAQFVVAGLSWAAAAAVYLRLSKVLGWATAFFGFVWAARFHNYDMVNIQVNHLILLFLFWGGWVWRENRVALAGVLLALGILFKVGPLLVLPVLLLGGRIRLTFAAIMALGVVGIAPGVIWWISEREFSVGMGLYAEWAHLLRVTTPFPAPSDPIFQSIAGALWSIWDPASSDTFRLTYVGVFLVMIGMTYGRASAPELPIGPVIAGAMILTALLSPLAWKHGYLLCLPAAAYLYAAGRKALFWLTFSLCTAIPGLMHAIAPRSGDRLYLLVIGALILWGAVLFDLRGASAVNWGNEGGDRPNG